MKRIQWTADMSVGIDLIDEDHKCLIELLNNFIDAVDNDEGVFVFDTLFQEFLDYTEYHFAREERLMAEAGYADLHTHAQGHAQLIQQLNDMREQVLLSVTSDMQDDVREFFLNWLQIHIMVKDQAYSAPVRRHLSAAA